MLVQTLCETGCSIVMNHEHVIGIDVGFSARRRSTCFCRLSWDTSSYQLAFACATSDKSERFKALRFLIPDRSTIAAVAIDGPLTKNLRPVNRYRSAEAILSRGVFQRRGKPGQTNSPMGQRLHRNASDLARQALKIINDVYGKLNKSNHLHPIHHLCLVEAFPNAFLAMLLPEGSIPPVHRNASDRFWEVLIKLGLFQSFLSGLLPNRSGPDLGKFHNHDERAAIVCALTALSVSKCRFVAVGDREDGFIVLPPREAWGRNGSTRVSWVETALRENVVSCRRQFSGARAILWDQEWF